MIRLFIIILCFFLALSCESRYKSPCTIGKTKAKEDFKNNIFKQPYLISINSYNDEFYTFLKSYAKSKYKIVMKEITSEYDEIEDCYYVEMSELLLRNFGVHNIKEEAWNEYLCLKTEELNLKDFHCFSVDTVASFQGGLDEMFNYLEKNLYYPEKSKQEQIQGNIYLSFIVAYNGEIRRVEVIKGLNKELDSLSISVIKKMPKWNPAKFKGNKVNSKYILPLRFVLKD